MSGWPRSRARTPRRASGSSSTMRTRSFFSRISLAERKHYVHAKAASIRVARLETVPPAVQLLQARARISETHAIRTVASGHGGVDSGSISVVRNAEAKDILVA